VILPHPIHGMYELMRWPGVVAGSPERRAGVRAIPLVQVVRGAHVMGNSVDGDEASATRWFINNYVDWDQFQDLYDGNFLSNGVRQAEDFFQQFERRYH
jgi:hypothetical protein